MIIPITKGYMKWSAGVTLRHATLAGTYHKVGYKHGKWLDIAGL